MILLFFPLVIFSQKTHNNYSVYNSDENLRITFEEQEYLPMEFWFLILLSRLNLHLLYLN